VEHSPVVDFLCAESDLSDELLDLIIRKILGLLVKVGAEVTSLIVFVG